MFKPDGIFLLCTKWGILMDVVPEGGVRDHLVVTQQTQNWIRMLATVIVYWMLFRGEGIIHRREPFRF
jgi:hypothetical protein